MKINIKKIIPIILGMIYIILPIKAVYAETVEENLNNLVGPKEQYNTMLSPVYLKSNTTEESISPQSGELTISQTDYVLPGINGLDLEIKRIYKSGTSNMQNMKVRYVHGAWVDYTYSDENTSTFYEDRYDMGIGIRFSFPQIEVRKSNDADKQLFLHSDSGDVYYLKPDGFDRQKYYPENQTVQDVKVSESSEYSNGQSDGVSKYKMEKNDGKKTYFADDGRLLGIVDRYGSIIKFEYTTQNYNVDGTERSKKLISKITDSVGRVVTIDYLEDYNYTVGHIENKQYSLEDSYKADQNPNSTDSGELNGKFQVVVNLPGDKKITYDKSAALVSSSKHVIRTRLQRVYDVDGKPKYHFWYDQPELGFTFYNGSSYSSFNRYENLVQIDYCKTNRIKRYVYDKFKRGLNYDDTLKEYSGSMEYQKIFEQKELIKKDFDNSKTQFIDKFVTHVKDKNTYKYTNEADGFGTADYKDDNTYLKNNYTYSTEKLDMGGNKTNYVYNGIHELIKNDASGANHKEEYITEYDELKLPKKKEVISYNIENGQSVKKTENYRYDNYGNLTNYTGPNAKRDDSGTPVNDENTVTYSYDYNRFCTPVLKTWKQDENTTCQVKNTIDDKGNIIKEEKLVSDGTDNHIVTDFEYDSHGNLTKKTVNSKENNYLTYYEYGIDADGADTKGAYLTREYTVQDGKEVSKKYSYDMTTGNKKSDTDANENKTSYDYDILGRLVKVTNPDSSNKTYSYIDSVNENSRIEYSDANGTRFANTYDILGNLINSSVWDNNQWKTLMEAEYDYRGNKIKEKDGNGNSSRFEYDSAGQLIKKSFYENDAVNKAEINLKYTLAYDADTALQLTVTDEEGYIKKSYYNIQNQLIKSETTADKVNYDTTTYSYDYVGNKTGTTDPLGNKTSFTYDQLGRLIKKIDAGQNETTYTYNSLDKALTVSEPDGRETSYKYDLQGRVAEERVGTKGSADYTYKKYSYDNAGNVLSVTQSQVKDGQDNPASKTEYSYNNMNRVTDEYRTIDDTRREHIKYSYDNNGNKTATTEFTDNTGNNFLSCTYQYDFSGKQISETGSSKELRDDGSYDINSEYRTLYQRDLNGNVIKEQKFNGTGYDETAYTYDYRNKPLTKVEPFRGDGSTKTTEFAYDKKGNLKSQLTTVSGEKVGAIYQYDGMGRVTGKTDAVGNTARYRFDANGNLTKEVDPRYQDIELDKAPGIEYEYDALNRQIKATVFAGCMGEQFAEQTTNHGTNRTVVLYKEYDGRGNVLKEADAAGYNAENPQSSYGILKEYDALNNVVKITSAQTAKDNLINGSDNFTKKFTYDGAGRLISETDSVGSNTKYEYFMNGKLKTKTDPDSYKTSYDYDLTGKVMTRVTDRAGNVTTTWNSIFGKPYRIEYPDGTTEAFNYTPKGYIDITRDKFGNHNYYTYDPSGNMLTKKEFIKDNVYALTVNTYDEANKITSSETFGCEGDSTVSSENKVSYTYDKDSRVTKVEGPDGRETIKEYDADGNLLTEKAKVSDGYYDVKRYSYDLLNRPLSQAVLVEMKDIDITKVASPEFDQEFGSRLKAANTYTYYDNGQVKTKKDANGNETSFRYDLDKHPIEKTEAGAGTQVYKYDLRGNLVQQTNSLNATTYFDYDSLNRIIRKNTPSTDDTQAITLYIYDANGNLKKTVQPNEYSKELDNGTQAMQMKGTSYDYDSMNRKIVTYSPDGNILEKISYTPMGKVEKTVDGLRLTDDFDKSPGMKYSYDGLGRVLQKIDAMGNTTVYEYNILGNLIKETDPRGNTTSYQYDTDGTMTKTTYADGTSIEYTYDRLGRKTSQKDQRGNVTQYSYTALGKVRTETDSYANTISCIYDLNGNILSLKDKRGNTTYFEYDAKNRVVEKKAPLELDAAGNVNFNIESSIYDTEGNLKRKTVSGTEEPGSSRETNYIYYPNNLVKNVSDSSGASKSSSYDLNGNLIRVDTLREDGKSDIQKYEYDNMNRVTKKITMVDENMLDLGDLPLDGVKDVAFPGMILMITGLSYDILGNKKKEFSPMAYLYADGSPEKDKYITNYSYDELNRLLSVTRKYGDEDVSTKYSYDSVGNKTKAINELGNETTYTYDSRNRLETQTDSYGNTFSYKYDEAGNKIQETNAKGDSVSYSYDRLNRQETVTDAYGTVIKKSVYDANGNITKSIDAKGYLSADNDDSRYGTINTYDMANRLIKVTDPEIAALKNPDKFTFRYAYSQFGEKLSSTDALGNTTSYEYDNAGRLVKVTSPTEETVSYGYDKAGNKLYMVDGRGKITRYSYGPTKIVKTIIDADGKEINYRYNLSGNVAEMLDRNGSTTKYVYDNRNLLIQKKVIETGDSISYSYDAVGNRVSMKDESGETAYTYDKNNKVAEISKDGTVQLTYTYDSVGNIESVTDFKGFITKYSYDKSNRMQNVFFSGNTTTYAYDKNGNRESIEYQGGVKETYTYDKNNKLITLTNQKPNGGEISKYSYTYYENGLQKTKADSYGTTQYDYDASGRVQKVTTPGKTTIYAYDKAGNRLSQNETYTSAQPTGAVDESTGSEIQYIIKKSEYVYSNTNQLLKLTGKMLDKDSSEVLKKETDYFYDANGNQLKQNSSFTSQSSIKKRQSTKGSAQGDDADDTISSLIERSSNTFDGFNRLKKVESVEDGVRTLAEYTYNGDDMRVRKSVKSSDDGYTEKVTSYLYDRQYVILETDGANAVKARYIKGVNYIAKLDASNNPSYFMYNGHGDVVQTVTAAGEVQNQYDYDIWGNPTLTVETEECSIRFAGEYLDGESGLYYLRARFYDSHLGRFINQDTFKGNDIDPLSLNLYTYCANNPVKYVDPSGHTYFQYGDSGDGVMMVQEKLIAVGLLDKGSADGIFGEQTLAAIKSFQEGWGFTPEGEEADGIVGNQTFQGLMALAEHIDDDGDTIYNMMDNIKNNVATGEIDGCYFIASEKTVEEKVEDIKTAYEATGEPVHVIIDNNSVQYDVNTDAEKVSLFADDGSDEYLGDGTESGRGTYNEINDLSWAYNEFYQQLKDLKNSDLDKNSDEYHNQFNSILSDMANLRNRAIDARNNYAWGNPDSRYAKYINGTSDVKASDDSTEISNTTEETSNSVTPKESTAQKVFQFMDDWGNATMTSDPIPNSAAVSFGMLAPLAYGDNLLGFVVKSAGKGGEAFVKALTKADDAVKVADKAIDVAQNVNKRVSYIDVFERELKNFNEGYTIGNKIDKDIYLVQFNGGNGSYKYWTTIEQANKFATIDDVMKNLALLPEWGERNFVSIAKIPAGTEVKYAVGTATEQTSKITGEKVVGGGVQYLFSEFDPSWILNTVKLP